MGKNSTCFAISVYCRQSDGRKVLRSSIREFLSSEAMFALGIPTTRAGSLVTSDLYVQRDAFYSGNPRPERCSVVLRIAPTFIRLSTSIYIYPQTHIEMHFSHYLSIMASCTSQRKFKIPKLAKQRNYLLNSHNTGF